MSVQSEKSRIRNRVRKAVSSLQRLDDELAELAESLSVPLDATEMWESRLPTSFPAHLHAAIDAVRSDCVQDAIDTLLRAVRQSDVSLRRQFLRVVGRSEKGGVSLPQKKTGNNAERKEPPPCLD
jgi:hypothetical protein